MWDVKYIQADRERVILDLARRGGDTDVIRRQVDEIITLARQRQELAGRVSELNRARRTMRDPDLARALRAEASDATNALKAAEDHLTALLSLLPNRLDDSVPGGSGEADNVVLSMWGSPRSFDFRVKDHVEVGTALGLDLEAGARLAGSGFPVLRGWMARLSRALSLFMLDLHRERGGYEEVVVPYLVNRRTFYGTAHLPKFADELYWTEGDALGAIPTAEVPLTNLPGPSILEADGLPLRFMACTPCFRREAGAHGQDTRGILRVHQFHKVELVRICAPEDGLKELEILTDHAEEVLRRLDLPHRRVLLCAGDTGFGAARTHDIEVWVPSADRYREVSSCSTCGDFQARRIGMRVRRSDGAKVWACTLNGSGLAVGRTLIALVENHQEADGSVRIPAALRPYLGGVEALVPGRA